jgi:copper transport protein
MRTLRPLWIALLSLSALALSAAPALAHVDIASTSPEVDSEADAPLTSLELVFTVTATPADGGIEVVDGSGALREPAAVTPSEDSTTWTVEFDEPLTPGLIAVRWTMRAGDAHPRSGSYTFELSESAVAASLVEPVPTTTAPADADDAPAPDSESRAVAPLSESVDLEDFLATPDVGGAAARLATLGRMLAMLGVMLGIGGLVFSATILYGTAGDVRHGSFWVRRFAVLAVSGAFLELVGQVVVDQAGRWLQALNPLAHMSTLASGVGIAIGLRLAGGAALVASTRLASKVATQRADVVAAIAERVPVGAGAHYGRAGALPPPDDGTAVRLDPTASRWAFAAALALIASFSFDGHTVTAGPRMITGLVDAIHVTGAAVWAGGVGMLVLTAANRRRLGLPTNLLLLSVRFSVIASIAVVAVGGAGLALAWLIIDGPSDLVTTSWGRILVAKIVLVAAAGAFGFRNHRTLIPNYLREPHNPDAHARLRWAVTIEAAVLAAVVVVTAVLVAASSV